jgi:DNA primase
VPTAQELGIDDVLDVLTNRFDLEVRIRGDEADILCPNPAHNDHNPSTGVNLNTGLWNCFSCGIAGDLLELGVYMLDLPHDGMFQKLESRSQVQKILEPSSPDAIAQRLAQRLAAATQRSSVRSRPAVSLGGPYEDGPLRYLRKRGFKQETLERWGVRFVPEETLENKSGKKYKISSTIAIPIRDEHAHLLAWCYRATDNSPDWQPRYLYNKDAELSELWWGMQHHSRERNIIITEGAIDAMWLDQHGIPALALLGASMGKRKIRQLESFRTVTLFLDRDEGGAKAVARIGGMIGDRLPLRVVRYPSWVGDDPNEMAGIDLELLVARAVPWQVWLQKLAQAKD